MIEKRCPQARVKVDLLHSNEHWLDLKSAIENAMPDNITELFQEYIQTVLTVVWTFIYLIVRSVARRIARRHARKHNIAEKRTMYTIKFINVLLGGVFLTFIAITWDVTFEGLAIYFASIFTIIGIAFFAQWSILSNVTSSVILFFYYTYKIGGYVRILDGENSVVGKIQDITLFYMIIETENGDVVSFPNSLAIQKAILQYPHDPPRGTPAVGRIASIAED